MTILSWRTVWAECLDSGIAQVRYGLPPIRVDCWAIRTTHRSESGITKRELPAHLLKEAAENILRKHRLNFAGGVYFESSQMRRCPINPSPANAAPNSHAAAGNGTVVILIEAFAVNTLPLDSVSVSGSNKGLNGLRVNKS